MSEQDLVGCYIKIKNLYGANSESFKFDVGDILEVVKAEGRTISIEFKFKDKPISWVARPEHYEIVAHPKEWYKDKWIVFTDHVGYSFLKNTPYQIKECYSISAGYVNFIFHNSPIDTFTKTSFGVAHDKYKIVDAPAKQESLLEEAKKRYPVGTRYKCVSYQNVYVVEKQTFAQHNATTIHGEYAKGCLYVDGRWAEIVSEKESLLDEARRRYPIGTRYKCARDGQEGVSIEDVYYDSDNNIYSKFKEDRFNQYVYVNGKWAEIVSTPSTKSKDELLLERAVRDYPIGTKYIALDSNGNTYGAGDIGEAVYAPKWTAGGLEVGVGWVYMDGNWAEIVKEDVPAPEKTIDDSLLEEAKKRYPVGTKYKCPKSGVLYTVKPGVDKMYTFVNRSYNDDIDAGFARGYFYCEGKWAEIVTNDPTPVTTEQALLEQARRRYPIGTDYYSVTGGNEVRVEGELKYYSDTDRITDGWGGSVYKQGKWADIVTPATITANTPVGTIAGTTVYDNGSLYISGGITFSDLNFSDIWGVERPSTPESKIQHIPDLNASLRKEKKQKRIKHL